MITNVKKYKILVIEDENDISDLITLHLNREGYQVEAAFNGEEGLQKIASATLPFDLIILDWMLPEISGLDITRKIRKNNSFQFIPILMVTARVETTDIVLGLEAGVDDYLTKPFEMAILLARVRALIRRSHFLQTEYVTPISVEKKATSLIHFSGISINLNSYEVLIEGTKINLTPSEFKLLTTLAQNQDKVLTRDQLLELLQGSEISVTDRTIDTHIFGLRKKLGHLGQLIETIRGIGYRIKTAE